GYLLHRLSRCKQHRLHEPYGFFAQAVVGRTAVAILLHRNLLRGEDSLVATRLQRVLEEWLRIERTVPVRCRNSLRSKCLEEGGPRETRKMLLEVSEHVKVVCVARATVVHPRRRDPWNLPQHRGQI